MLLSYNLFIVEIKLYIIAKKGVPELRGPSLVCLSAVEYCAYHGTMLALACD